MKVSAILWSSVLAVSACAHNPATSASAVRITLNVIVDGSVSFAYQGQTLSSPGSYTFTVPAGLQEISGQLTGRFVGFVVHTLPSTDGARSSGPQPGSIQGVQGPSPRIERCSVDFQDFSPSPSAESFRFQFMVTLSPAGTCD